MFFPERKYSFYKDITFDSALDFSKRSSFVKEIMLERIYPSRIILPMKQHYGVPCIPAVRIGEKVSIGQCIGLPEQGSFASPVHSGISGEVTEIAPIRMPDGTVCEAVTIVSDRKRTFHPGIVRRSDPFISARKVIGIIANAGIVGLGGEGIPTVAKINRARATGVDELLVNCLQSEPYATSDLIRITDSAEYLVMGAVALAGAVGVTKINFLISEKRSTEITALHAAMERTAGAYSGYVFNLRLFKERFPQGYYRLVANALYDKELKRDQTLEETCRAVMFNCSTVCACWEAIADGMPLVSRAVTIMDKEGNGHNVLAPIGTPISELTDFGSDTDLQNCSIIIGNALTGKRVEDPRNTPIIKTTSAVHMLRRRDNVVSGCIHCSSCMRACPMGINPGMVKSLIENRLPETAEQEGALDCIACGACSYMCPSGIPLSETISRFAATYQDPHKQRREVPMSERIDIGSVSLLENYNEAEETDKEDDTDRIVLPFEGGKFV